ncbi:MAG: signal peptidase I [Lachnospiraceae bacterium]|nr:signal peptidase I [Lachnospiraceae bacterium]
MKKWILGLVCVIAIAAVAGGIGWYFVKDYRVVEVTGEGMVPTLEAGDYILCDTSVTSYERYDLVIVQSDYDGGGLYAERIIGLPGETVRIEEGIIYINEEPLDDPYYYEADFNGYDAWYGVTLGENEYFVLGDNRNNSADSRLTEFGSVSLSDIEGKIIFRLWPMDGIGSMKNQ